MSAADKSPVAVSVSPAELREAREMVDELITTLSAASQCIREMMERMEPSPTFGDPTLTALMVRKGIAAVQHKEGETLFRFVRRLEEDAERVAGNGHADA